MYKEMSKIKGVVVYQLNKTTAMDIGINSTTEMLEFEEKTPPEGLYDVPAGYKAEKNPAAEDNRSQLNLIRLLLFSNGTLYN